MAAKNSRGRKTQPDMEIGGMACTARSINDEEWERRQAEQKQLRKQQIGATINVLGPAFGFHLEQLQQQVYEANALQGFWDGAQDSVPGKIALMHTELSEMLEADRKGIEVSEHLPEFTGIEEEAADMMIRLMDFSGRFNLRLGQAVTAKLLFNLNRPHKHGKGY